MPNAMAVPRPSSLSRRMVCRAVNPNNEHLWNMCKGYEEHSLSQRIGCDMWSPKTYCLSRQGPIRTVAYARPNKIKENEKPGRVAGFSAWNWQANYKLPNTISELSRILALGMAQGNMY